LFPTCFAARAQLPARKSLAAQARTISLPSTLMLFSGSGRGAGPPWTEPSLTLY